MDFFHMSMASESIKYTAFIIPLSYHEYLKMPFGLKVGPARFQWFIYDFKWFISKINWIRWCFCLFKRYIV